MTKGQRPILAAVPVVAAVVLSACGGGSVASAVTPAKSTPKPAPRSAPAAAPVSAPTRRARQPASRQRQAKATVRCATGRVVTIRRRSRYGPILTDGGGNTIYTFTRDHSTSSTCYGHCAAVWPPVLTRGAPRLAGNLTKRIGTTRRRDGTMQVTYAGHPLYYFAADTSPGQILCENALNFGGIWLVVSPRGVGVR